jgi:hypothetical protein
MSANPKKAGRKPDQITEVCKNMLSLGYSEKFVREVVFLMEFPSRYLMPLDAILAPEKVNLGASDIEREFFTKRTILKKKIKKSVWDNLDRSAFL